MHQSCRTQEVWWNDCGRKAWTSGLVRDSVAPGAYSETFSSMSLSSYMVSNTSPSVSLKDTATRRQTLVDIFNVSSTGIKHLFEKKKSYFRAPWNVMLSFSDSFKLPIFSQVENGKWYLSTQICHLCESFYKTVGWIHFYFCPRCFSMSLCWVGTLHISRSPIQRLCTICLDHVHTQ